VTLVPLVPWDRWDQPVPLEPRATLDHVALVESLDSRVRPDSRAVQGVLDQLDRMDSRGRPDQQDRREGEGSRE